MSIDNLDLSSERPGINYYKLRDLLAAKQWVEADQETLARMCAVMGRASEGWLQIGDIEQFPCQDLKIIDQLWVHYSQGKFGFSVQKKIWQDCGSPTTFHEDWERFAEAIAWMSEGEWKDYSMLTQSLSRSSFPVINRRYVWVGDRLQGTGALLSLLSRAETCKL